MQPRMGYSATHGSVSRARLSLGVAPLLTSAYQWNLELVGGRLRAQVTGNLDR